MPEQMLRIIPPPELAALIANLTPATADKAIQNAFDHFVGPFETQVKDYSGPAGRFRDLWKVDATPSLPGMTTRNFFDKAGWVEFPTKPHIILPVRGRLLAWTQKGTGKTIFAKRVIHPGTKGYNAYERSVDETRPLLFEMVGTFVRLGFLTGGV